MHGIQIASYKSKRKGQYKVLYLFGAAEPYHVKCAIGSCIMFMSLWTHSMCMLYVRCSYVCVLWLTVIFAIVHTYSPSFVFGIRPCCGSFALKLAKTVWWRWWPSVQQLNGSVNSIRWRRLRHAWVRVCALCSQRVSIAFARYVYALKHILQQYTHRECIRWVRSKSRFVCVVLNYVRLYVLVHNKSERAFVCECSAWNEIHLLKLCQWVRVSQSRANLNLNLG